jgi:hypothetical protein
MSTPLAPELGDGEFLLHEIQHEASSLAHHPLEEVRRLAHLAADGESGTTPLLLSLGVTVVIVAVLAVFLTAAMLLYYLD